MGVSEYTRIDIECDHCGNSDSYDDEYEAKRAGWVEGDEGWYCDHGCLMEAEPDEWWNRDD